MMERINQEGTGKTNMLTYKIVLGGRWGVGKTSLRRNFMGDARFKRNYLPTIGSDFSYKEMEYDSRAIRLLIWDLAGEVRFRKFRNLYFQGASGALLVFDLTDLDTFHTLDEWVNDLKTHTSSDGVPIVVLGNKSDLILDESERCVTQEEINQKLTTFDQILEGRFDIKYLETSALSGKNVNKAFNTLLISILEWYES